VTGVVARAAFGPILVGPSSQDVIALRAEQEIVSRYFAMVLP
jgi:hypothetical protein